MVSLGSRAKRELVWRQLLPTAPDDDRLPGARLVPVENIDPNPDQPRRGALPEIPELAGNILEYGLLQPVVVAPPVDGRYQLIAGARRLAAYRYLLARERRGSDKPPDGGRWATIPALVRDTATVDRLLLALVENLSRQNLSDADTITALRQLRDLQGWSGAEIARRLGVTRQWVNQQFKVAGDPELAEYVQRGQLTTAKAREVRAAKSPMLRQEALAVALRGGSYDEVYSTAKGQLGGPTAPHLGLPRLTENEGQSTPAVPGGNSGGGDGQTSPAAPAVTGAPAAGVRDWADLARELGVTVPFTDLAITPLVALALREGLPLGDAEALIKAMREDLRRLEGLVRTAQQQRRRSPAFPTR